MPECKKCKATISADMRFCPYCGREQAPRPRRTKRGNGQGSVYKLPNGKYKAEKTLGYWTDEDGKRHRKNVTKIFIKRSDAIAALPSMGKASQEKLKQNILFADLYAKWLPTHRAGRKTMDCYKAAYKHFRPVWMMRMADIDIDDLQDCIDNCGHGKRTQQNMKTLCGLMYKYGIPRRAIPENLNLSQFLVVGGDGAAHRQSFTDIQIQKIKEQIGLTFGAEYVYCLIYLGFRPSEFLALTASDYNAQQRFFVGGAKTESGINRTVTVSPKIQPYITQIVSRAAGGQLITDESGMPYSLKYFTEMIFYPVLQAAGIDNPMVEIAGGVKRHKYTPHSCRHTFSTLLKRVEAPSKDKLELIGHSNEEQLRYYQDVAVDDLRHITDAI